MMQFNDVQYMTAKEKEKVYKNFKQVVAKRDINLMQKSLYNHLHLHCGFIAHYDIHGFKAEYSGQNFRRFIEWLMENPHLVWGDYTDINGGIREYLAGQYQQILAELDAEQANRELILLRALAEKHGIELPPMKKDVAPFTQTSLFDAV